MKSAEKGKIKHVNKLEAQVSLYHSPDINKPSIECLHAEYI